MTTNLERQIWKVEIAAPIETVWNTLVQTDEVLPFLFGSICQADGALQAGKPMRMLSRDGKFVVCFGRVLEFSPPTRFSHTITFAMSPDAPAGKTTYELRAVAGGTELTLISEAVAGTQTAKMARSGQFIVDNLKQVLETGRPTFAGRMMLAMTPVMGLFTPSRCRASQWPLSRVAQTEAWDR